MRTRPYTEDDYADVIAFLRRLYELNPERPFWLPARWEYATYLVSPLYRQRGFADWVRSIRIWEEVAQGIVAVVNSENPDEQAYLHVHPSHRDLEASLLDWAEGNIAAPDPGGSGAQLVVWAREGDAVREDLLAERGYRPEDARDYLLWQELSSDPPEIALPGDYSIHTMEEPVDLDEKIACMTRAFRSEPYPPEIYRTMQRGRSYLPELDLFTRDARGVITSFCIVWFDREARIGYFEPVGTHPEHQRRGLGSATLVAGLRRLKRLGATRAYVGASGDWRKSFYVSAGFERAVASRPWRKHLRTA